jgi:hypothetical protein
MSAFADSRKTLKASLECPELGVRTLAYACKGHIGYFLAVTSVAWRFPLHALRPYATIIASKMGALFSLNATSSVKRLLLRRPKPPFASTSW